MAKCYLLPCEKCDHQLKVEARQAGRTLDCPECEASVDVPTFRVMKTLAAEGGDQAKEAVVSEPNAFKGILFATGLGIAVVAGAAGWALYNYSSSMQLFKSQDMEQLTQGVSETMDEATVSELWDGWVSTIDRGDLPDWQESQWNRDFKQGTILMNASYGIFGLAGLGVLCFLTSFFLPNSKTA
jgi:hypothetical protein